MPIIIPNEEIQQGTPEWMDLRLGIPTASEFSNIIKRSGKRSDSRGKYLEKLADERLRRMVENTFESSAMKRGKIMEPESRQTFEEEMFRQGNEIEVVQVAFVYADERRRYGCSPDGLIFTPENIILKGFETKDAKSEIQERRLEREKKVLAAGKPIESALPSKHFHQVQGSMFVCGCESWYFRSYCRGMRALTLEIKRDEKFIKALSRELEVFCDELDMIVERRRNA